MTRASSSVRERHHSRREESGSGREQNLVHVPVMLDEVLVALALKSGDVVVDATYGRGGHSAAIKKAAKVRLVTVDADAASGADITGNFGDLKALLKRAGVKKINKALFDLGWNMTQLDAGRGFSFLRDEPLTMSYGDAPRSGFTATQMLNTFSEKALADILYGYGEERYARRIAAAVVARRDRKEFETTFELVELIKDVVPPAYRHGRLNPATRSFQALRIAVNDELAAAESGLSAAWKMLAPAGRIVVITFHSIEDHLVKKLFRQFAQDGGHLIYKKPLSASREEVAANAASRSAKLRAIEKI